MDDAFDAYRTLQVDREADPDVIQAAYRRLAQKYHPDANPGPDAAERMIAINRAWDLLRDPERRRAYDRAAAGTRAAAPTDAARGGPAGGPVPPAREAVSPDRTSGRSSSGHAYGPSMRVPDGQGAAGPPPGRPSGSVLSFGRYAGWSLGEIARVDLDHLEWLERMSIGRAYRDEIDEILRRVGRRRVAARPDDRPGLSRRR